MKQPGGVMPNPECLARLIKGATPPGRKFTILRAGREAGEKAREWRHRDRKPQSRHATGSRSSAAPGPRADSCASGESEAAEADPRLRFDRRGRRHSHRRAKASAGDGAERSDSRLHLRRELVEVRGRGLETPSIAPRTQKRLRPRPP